MMKRTRQKIARFFDRKGMKGDTKGELNGNQTSHSQENQERRRMPDDNHVVRYVRPRMIYDFEKAEVDGKAFCLREGESGLSVNCLEAFSGDKGSQLSKVKQKIRLTLSKNAGLAELNVGKVRQIKSEKMETLHLDVISDPSDAENSYDEDPSHALIVGLPKEGAEEAVFVGDLIKKCVCEVHTIGDIP